MTIRVHRIDPISQPIEQMLRALLFNRIGRLAQCYRQQFIFNLKRVQILARRVHQTRKDFDCLENRANRKFCVGRVFVQEFGSALRVASIARNTGSAMMRADPNYTVEESFVESRRLARHK